MEDEIYQLLKLAQKGNNAAKQKIVELNINLVRSIVYRFRSNGYEWDDLFQLGCMGMIKAIERFDTSFNVRFSTYAVPMIIGEIKRFMRDDQPVKVSRSLKCEAWQINKAAEKLRTKLGREPTLTELSRQINISPEEIAAAQEAARPILSLDEPQKNINGDECCLLEQLSSQQINHTDRLALYNALRKLPEKERLVLFYRFFNDLTQSEIADRLKVSQVQISRIEKKAITQLRNLLYQ